MVTSYYDTGVADDSLYVYQPLSFKTSTSATVLAKLLVVAIVFLIALVIAALVLVVWFFRRRKNLKS